MTTVGPYRNAANSAKNAASGQKVAGRSDTAHQSSILASTKRSSVATISSTVTSSTTPLVGTVREFVAHLVVRASNADGGAHGEGEEAVAARLVEGRLFDRADEAVVGAATPFPIGDVRRAMSVLALATQALVAIAVMLALSILMHGFARRFAMLRALGAPRRHVFAVVWRYAPVLVGTGTALGLVLGMELACALSRVLTARTGVDLGAGIAVSDAVPVAAFVPTGAVLAAVPAWCAAGREAHAASRAR